MPDRLWLSLATMGGEERRFVQEAFDTNWVVPLGPNVTGFEEDLKRFLGQDKPVTALCSGTAALHLALIQCGVTRDDEVICQSFTFAASANPIAYLGAVPVFVDSERETWNMSPLLLEEAIQDRIAKIGRAPKAIVGVDLYGMPAQWDQIGAVADRYGIPVIEDAAEALGSELNGRKCGTFGRFGVLSFNGNKIITTSGGGALVCPNDDAARKTVFLATQARDPAPHYEHSEIGYNYRLSNVCAGIGRGQMLALDGFVRRRREIHALYAERLADVRGISVKEAPAPNHALNYWLTTVLVGEESAGHGPRTDDGAARKRERLRLALDAENIESRPLWKPMHLQPVFSDAPFYGNRTSETLFEQGLCLPSGAGMTASDIDRVCDIIRKVVP
ncbi:MAG: DegT/DnrJ/EryC1/StrS family aminotransferase [Planctomycetes bacterium]|nr:DegT/DnrJ/EryC1/StrS family aminotransferase [Planctomycetota bacterium]